MKLQSKKSVKMADLHFVDFALIPSPVRKEKQFRLPDDFSEFDFTVLPRTNHSAFGFPALFRVLHHGQIAVRRSVKWFYTTRVKQEISTFPLSEAEIVAY